MKTSPDLLEKIRVSCVFAGTDEDGAWALICNRWKEIQAASATPDLKQLMEFIQVTFELNEGGAKEFYDVLRSMFVLQA